MKDTTIMALGESLGKIAKLESESEEAEHTDIGDIWDVLKFAQSTLRSIVSEVIGDDDEDQDALDSLVHDRFSALASDMNNAGADAQRAFLSGAGDPPGVDRDTALKNILTPAKPKMDKVCEECGESDISFEGWIGWSVESQEFYVIDICDKGHHCKTCDGMTHSIDVEYKPLALVIEVAGDPTPHNYRFHTQAELTAFREGYQKCHKYSGDSKFEITYTDEESTCD